VSWVPETCVVAGYKVPQEAAAEAWSMIEDDYDVKGCWEDFFVDPDPIGGSDYIFFGKIIFNLDEHDEPVRFENIMFSQKDVDEVNKGFNILFGKWCADHNYFTKFDKWLMIRYT